MDRSLFLPNALRRVRPLKVWGLDLCSPRLFWWGSRRRGAAGRPLLPLAEDFGRVLGWREKCPIRVK